VARARACVCVCVLCVACGTWVRVSERVSICVASIHSLWLRGGTGCTSDPTGVTKPRTQRIAVHPIDSARIVAGPQRNCAQLCAATSRLVASGGFDPQCVRIHSPPRETVAHSRCESYSLATVRQCTSLLRNHSLSSTPHDQCHCYFVRPVYGLSLRLRVPTVPAVRGLACSGGHQQPDQVRLVQIDALRDHALPKTDSAQNSACVSFCRRILTDDC
jgi:hypothetical protein